MYAFRFIRASIIILSLMFASPVFAGPESTTASESNWMGMLEMQKKIINDYGFTIKLLKIDGNCYEIYGWEEKKGKVDKIEVYFNPVNCDNVKKEVS